MPDIRNTRGSESDCGIATGWVSSEVQRCWCWRLCRIWVAVALWGVGGLDEGEEMSDVSAEGGGGEDRGVEVVIFGYLV